MNEKIREWLLLDPKTGDDLELAMYYMLNLQKCDGLSLISVISTLIEDLAERAGVTPGEIVEHIGTTITECRKERETWHGIQLA